MYLVEIAFCKWVSFLLRTVAVRVVAALSVLLFPAVAQAVHRPLPPIISQRFPHGREPGYRGDNRCGPTNMAMVARGFHRWRWLSDAELIDRLDLLDDGQVDHATTPDGIVRMSEALGLRARVHLGFSGAWVKQTLRRGGLVIALGRPRYLPQTQAHTGGHFVSIVGFTRHGRFIVNDPYRRTSKRGARYRVSESTMASFVRHKPNGQLFAIDQPPRLARARIKRRGG